MRVEQEETERTEILNFLLLCASCRVAQLSIGAGQNQPADPVTNSSLVEIDEQSNRNIQQLHIAQELGLVDRQDFLHGFGFYEHTSLYQNIES